MAVLSRPMFVGLAIVLELGDLTGAITVSSPDKLDGLSRR